MNTNTSTQSPSRSEVRLSKILDDYLAAIQRGVAPDRSALLAAHPDLAEDLNACLASLDFLRTASPTDRLATDLGEDGSASRLLGDFRILREVGRGGMGVVYEADQISLGRRVALKVLPFAAALDSRQLKRFKTEAQAAAQLHHTNIVPVFWVGCEQGVHYYAMQFIEGRSLAEVIRDMRQAEGKDQSEADHSAVSGDICPSPRWGKGARRAGEGEAIELGIQAEPGSLLESRLEAVPAGPAEAMTPAATSTPPATRHAPPTTRPHSTRTRSHFLNIARLGIEAAEALEYAHQEGIIHRDIKPANLMIDAKGHLWVTDFGLARLQSDSGLTITGDVIGTLRYMSPEQALGRRVLIDARTDIYSLGVTLYELLTLQPAFESNDRQELLRQIANEEPRSPRKMNASIPRELETIILKAMSKEAESRYITGQQLADDLRRFLEEKPIRARRPSFLEHMWKWARRHRAAVTSTMVLLTLATAALGAGNILIARERAEAVRQRDRARKAVDDMYTDVAEKWLAQQPELELLQREFLLKALDLYQEFARDRGADPAAQAAAAQAERRVGDIRGRMGEHAEAERAYRAALALQQALASRIPRDPQCRQAVSDIYSRLGRLLGDSGRLREAELAHRRALELAQDLLAELAGNPECTRRVIDSQNQLGLLLKDTGHLSEAGSILRSAAEHGKKLLALAPNNTEFRRSVATTYLTFGNLGHMMGQLPEAEASLCEGLRLRRAMHSSFPRDPNTRSSLANCYTSLGSILNETRRPAEAELNFRAALELYESLAAEFPRVPDYRKSLAVVCFDLGITCYRTSRLAEAERLYRRALDLQYSLACELPELPEHRRHLAKTCTNLGTLLRQSGRPADSETLLRRAVELREALAAKFPTVPDDQSSLGADLHNLGNFYEARGDFAQARRLFERAIDHQRAALHINPDHRRYREYLTKHYRGLASTSVGLGDHSGGARAIEGVIRASVMYGDDLGFAVKSLARCARLAEADPMLPDTDRVAQSRGYIRRVVGLLRAKIPTLGHGTHPNGLNNAAWFLSTCPDVQFRDPVRAVELAKKAIEQDPKDRASWNTLGVAEYRAGAWEPAIKALLVSNELASGGSPGDWLFLAMAYWRKRDEHEARKWYDRSIAWLDERRTPDEEMDRFRAEAAALLGLTVAWLPNGPEAFANLPGEASTTGE